MLAWNVFVYRIVGEGERVLLARWMTGAFGLKWLDEFIQSKKAVSLGGDGYPVRYTLKGSALRQALLHGLPTNHSPMVIGEDYVMGSGWNGERQVDEVLLADCGDDEDLALEAWDQS